MRKSSILTIGLCLTLIFTFGLIFDSSRQAESGDVLIEKDTLSVLEPSINEALISEQYSIDIPEPQVKETAGKIYYHIEDFGVNAVLALPVLPHKKYYFQIPHNAKDITLELVQTESRSLGTIYNLGVFEGLASMANPEYDLVAARERYTLDTFPENNFKYLGERYLKGHRLLCVGINPLVQNLSANELIFHNKYIINIQYRLDETLRDLDTEMRTKKSPAFEKTAKEIIYNYQQIQPLEAPLAAAQTVSLIPVGDMEIKYAIITLPGNVSAVQPLADWKTKKGIPAEVYTTDWISANYPATDLQKSIRLFLTEPNPNSPYQNFYTAKFDWLLIAGEQGAGMPENDPPPEGRKLPSRYVGAPGYYWYSGDEDQVPADYYYADCADPTVTGYDWDTNDNGIYGELTDNILWIPDTYVGRIASNLGYWLNKVITNIIDYEKNPDVGTWTKSALLGGAKLDDSNTGEPVMEAIKADFLDGSGFSTDRLYYVNPGSGEGFLDEANFASFANSGRTIIEWFSHGGSFLAISNPDDIDPIFVTYNSPIQNGSKRSVVYAAACSNAHFDYWWDYPPIAHALCLSDIALEGYAPTTNAWGIAFVGAARPIYYWKPVTHPASQGSAQGAQYRFNEQIFSLGKYNVGQALYDMKLDMVTDFDMGGTFDPDTSGAERKNLFAMNLLGDPEMPIWTDEPQQFNVDYPSEVYDTAHDHIITVEDGTSSPVEGAQVTLYKEGDSFGTGLTDVNGEVTFTVSTSSIGTMDLTVTKHNFVPFTAVIAVVVEPPPRYDLTISAGSGGNTNPAPGVYNYEEGFEVPVIAIADSCYSFDHWELDGVGIGSKNPTSVLMDEDHNLHAVFVQDSYNLTITTTSGGTTNPVPDSYVYTCGSNVPLTADPDASYLFDHWELDGIDIGSENPTSVLMDEDHNLHAVFVLNEYDLTITASEGGTTDPAVGIYTYIAGSDVAVTALADEYHAFDHWELDGIDRGSENPISVSIDDDHGLHAVFELKYICGDANTDGGVNVGDIVYLIDHVFKNGPAPDPLLLGDANSDGGVNVGDIVYLIDHVFKNGPPPSAQPGICMSP